MRASVGIALVVGVLAGALGPRLVAPDDKPAGVAFEYVPPDGFMLQPKGTTDAILGADGAEKIWVYPLFVGYTPNVSLVTTKKAAVTTMAEVDALVQGMPATFASSGITWVEVRHELKPRADGARVAIIEGECEKGTIKYRSMQMVFPNDAGTAIVTASFPLEDAAGWERKFEKSVLDSKGVAVRHPPPETWTHLAWGGGAALVAYLALALRERGRPAPAKNENDQPPPSAKTKRAKDEDRSDDDDDA